MYGHFFSESSDFNFLDISLNEERECEFMTPPDALPANDSNYLDISRCTNGSIVLNSSETDSESILNFHTQLKGYIF